MRSMAGMATDRGTSTCASILPQIFGWLVGCCVDTFWIQEAKDMGQGGSEVGT